LCRDELLPGQEQKAPAGVLGRRHFGGGNAASRKAERAPATNTVPTFLPGKASDAVRERRQSGRAPIRK